MKFKPITAVWEITMGCNMRCKHCGSACESALKGELSTKEAIELCKDIGKMGFKWVTLSGGEPTIRKDWYLIAKNLNENNVTPTMITNGWLLDEKIADMAVQSGVNTIAISLDGLCKTHDYIRKVGSFERIMNAFDILKKSSINVAAITTINKLNINELEQLKNILITKGVRAWQLQLGAPMGNLEENSDLLIEQSYVDEVINFAYKSLKDDIEIQLADCIGYFNKNEIEVRKHSSKKDFYSWLGCGAGKHSMGILHNGDILGCTSIRDRSFIEGNIRETPLKDIWENENSFKWNRELTKDKLSGICGKCVFGEECLGGCANMRLTFGKDLYNENRYCSYNIIIRASENKFEKLTNVEQMYKKARKFMIRESFQLAELLLEKIIKLNSDNIEALKDYGYASYMLGNYQNSQWANKKVLEYNPDDAYANKGMGISTAKLGNIEQGIHYLKKAISLSGKEFTDPIYDLAVLLYKNNRIEESLKIIKEGREKYPEFINKSQKLYELLLRNNE